LYVLSVSLHVSGKFLKPVVLVGLRGCGCLTVWVSVPKAAVDEYDCPLLGEDDIGLPGQLTVFWTIHRESEAEMMKQASRNQFWLGMLAGYSAHHPRAMKL